MDHAGFVASTRAKIVEMCQRMIDGEVDIVSGATAVSELRSALAERDDPLFLAMRSVASQADQFPSPEQRALWSQDALTQADLERDELIAIVKNDVLRSCREIIDAYS